MKVFHGRLISTLLTAVMLWAGLHTARSQPTTRGTEFWVSFMENLELSSNGMPRFSFLISSDVNTTGAITLPATGYVLGFTAQAGQVTEVFLPAGIFYPQGWEKIDSTGFLVTSRDPIQLSVHHHRLYFSEASMILPYAELGDQYLVMAHSDDYMNTHPSQFVVLATENNTVVEITPSVLTKGLRPPGVTFAVTLHKGWVYQVQSHEDLTGTLVKARDGKKIALFSGSQTANVACYFADNHVYDQNYPVAGWGNEFITVPFAFGLGDLFRILAAYDQTQVSINCTSVKTLHKGEYFDTILSQPARINASFPVAIGQFKRSQNCSNLGDPSLLILPPVIRQSNKIVFNTLTSAIAGNTFTQHYACIVARTSCINYVYKNGINYGSVFSSIPNSDYSWTILSLSPGTHVIQSDSGFYAYAYGYKDFDSYTHFLGYENNYVSFGNSLNIDTPGTMCAGSAVEFSAGISQNVSSWSWSFGDGGSSPEQNPKHVYSKEGSYQVTLTVGINGGCPLTAERLVTIGKCGTGQGECEIFVPNAFSPNKDGANDLLFVRGRCIKEFSFQVYDRWGEKVFETTDRSKGWDGTYKGRKLNSAVFVYTLTGYYNNGTAFSLKGNITLVR